MKKFFRLMGKVFVGILCTLLGILLGYFLWKKKKNPIKVGVKVYEKIINPAKKIDSSRANNLRVAINGMFREAFKE
jgi:LPXTG-motif cell wall-anchored protein